MILVQEGDNPRVSGMFFKAVVQAVVVFSSGTWVMAPCMGRALGNFEHGVDRWITRRYLRRHE